MVVFSCRSDVMNCCLLVVLVSCGGRCSVYARRNDAGTMISVVMSFVVKWCSCCCVLFVFRIVAQGVLSQVLFSMECWFSLGFFSMLKDELVCY